jgi:hypothetical protein
MNTAPPTHRTALDALLYRWFVQYNPLYLLSAALVLVGLTVTSDALADDTSAWGRLGVGVLSEAYAFALIAGAAVLTRLALPRPAVFVALIAVLYQGDLALGTETFALIGRVGLVASFIWFAAFYVKLRALAWALRLELSATAAAIPSFGALGVALIPHLSRRIDSGGLTIIVGAWLFVLFAAALWTTRSVTSRSELDARGRTVLSRSMRATWAIWACLAIGHIYFWTQQYNLAPTIFVPIALLLATRWVQRELAVLACVGAALVFVARAEPALFNVTAQMSALVLALHALRKPIEQTVRETPQRDDYRATGAAPAERVPLTFVMSPMPALARQLAWSGYAAYLAAWTSSWSGGPLPGHIVPLDLAASAVIALVVWKSRVRVVALPLLGAYLHWSIQTRLLRAPQSSLQWGLATFATGFAMLVGSVVTSWRLAPRKAAPPHAQTNHSIAAA